MIQKKHIIPLIIIILLFIGLLLFDINQQPEEDNQPIACTMDAKLCPDGSYVGREGPDCSFTPCP